MLAIADLLDSMINIRDYAGEAGRTDELSLRLCSGGL
jgi:hypothetical protein